MSAGETAGGSVEEEEEDAEAVVVHDTVTIDVVTPQPSSASLISVAQSQPVAQPQLVAGDASPTEKDDNPSTIPKGVSATAASSASTAVSTDANSNLPTSPTADVASLTETVTAMVTIDTGNDPFALMVFLITIQS